MAVVYLGLGSNLGDRLAVLRVAIAELAGLGYLERVSSIYETEPWGDTDQPKFLNLCCRLRTHLAPRSLLAETQAIERRLGRLPTRRWGPRLIDIDLLTYDELTLSSPELTLPHPSIAERAFVLVPLAELAPRLCIPGHTGSVSDLLQHLPGCEQSARLVAPGAGSRSPTGPN